MSTYIGRKPGCSALQTLRERWMLCCVALLPVIVAGCASPKPTFETKRDSSYDKKLERVLIVYHHEATPTVPRDDFPDSYVKACQTALETKNVQASALRLTKDDFDEAARIRTEVSQFHPRQVLYFHVGSWTQYAHRMPNVGNVSSYSANLELTLVDPATAKTIWKARVAYPFLPDPETVAQQLVERLVTDGML